MSNSFNNHAELVTLIERQLESRISQDEFARLETLVRNSPSARCFYREYLDLHGMLHWEAAQSSDSAVSQTVMKEAADVPASSAACQTIPVTTHRPVRTPRRFAFRLTALFAGLLAMVASFIWWSVSHSGPQMALPDPAPVVPAQDALVADATAEVPQLPERVPVKLPEQPLRSRPDGSAQPVAVSIAASSSDHGRNPSPDEDGVTGPAASGSAGALVAFIDEQIQAAWRDHEVTASPRADDSEWLRRVYLDTVGHIPESEQVTAFLKETGPDKRQRIVDQLLDDQDYIRNWTTIWSGLLIGRSNPRNVNRASLQKYLREAFARNRGWHEIVTDFISAEGSGEDNGAANFLLAHLNNQAVPATAITARLFLGQQLQCTQCHNHPFNEQKQDEFWAFNSFFQQVEMVDRPRGGNPRVREVALRDRDGAEPTFYETRNGLQMATFPRYEDVRVDIDSGGRLRQRLAQLLVNGDSPQVARAFVNRMWHHFLGAAFTPEVDDMGPHVAVVHSEVLDRLTREFVRSGYDVKQLIRWICATESYNLSSRMSDGNRIDDPSAGQEALFSRVYVKPMTVEQVFDSLMIATQARELFGPDWDSLEKKRQEWLQQFVMAWDTDDNDEADLFNGSIPQALMLMNGELVKLTLEVEHGTLLDKVVRSRGNEQAKIEQIALATLSRRPTAEEAAAVRRLIRDHTNRRSRGDNLQAATRDGLEDLFWAYLNSNEFILVH